MRRPAILGCPEPRLPCSTLRYSRSRGCCMRHAAPNSSIPNLAPLLDGDGFVLLNGHQPLAQMHTGLGIRTVAHRRLQAIHGLSSTGRVRGTARG